MIIACDIDGVLADPRGFLHILPDWDTYFASTQDFPPILEMCALVEGLILVGHQVVFITGRPERNRKDTAMWLLRSIPNSGTASIAMRQNGDHRSSAELKLGMAADILPELVIDDEPGVTDALRAAGYTVLQVHGYRLTSLDGVPYTENIGDII